MPKVRTIYRGGSRFYVHPENREVVHPGVTSVIGMLPKQNFLGPWNAKMAAELAVDSIDFVADMAARDRDGAVQYLSGAARRYTKVRADLGSEAHDLFERLIRGEYVGRTRADLTPYVEHFREFLTAVNPELVRAEDVAWSDTYGYAGSFDVVMRVWLDDDGKPTPDRSGTPHLIMGDWKTSKATYPDVALQMSAYMNADFIIDPDGNRQPMPEFDGAAVLHITDETWAFKPVETGPDVFAQFLHLRATFDWDRDGSRKVIGKPVAKKAGGRITTGTQRRAR
ncbi:exonuclease [Streptomyces phage Lilbooboo]|uniref:Cas4 family exonuclease n=1 Tax=Streptomyces phage Lilbooboo TaxID=2510571 RepID=A0A411B315_9CAUD|nr:exonuclease [Streptomyces phage Lilbooboo]QAX94724.1 Cas4 family exonuclease [Streptomyces phage Lilbooboo]